MGTERRLPLRSVLRPLLGATALFVLYYLIPIDDKPAATTAAILLLGLLAVLALFIWQIRAIQRATHPRLRAVEALATTIPLFILLFSITYYLIGTADPAAFSEHLTRTDSLYFTLTTLSTVGFGDIVAVSQPTRVVVIIQLVGDILLIGVAARIAVNAARMAVERKENAAMPPNGKDSPPET